MTLIEALEYIQSAETCDAVLAQVYLKRGIGQRVISVKWGDSSGPNDKPDVTKLQYSQLVLSRPGLAPSGTSLRSLLVFRSAVHATWPSMTSETATPLEGNPKAMNRSAQEEAKGTYERWMSLVEASEHIRISQRDCDSVDAMRQLKQEIRDGLVRVRWEDSEGPEDCPDPEYLQTSQLLLVGTGLAPDKVEEIYRPLLVERSAVRELWRLSNERRKGSRQIVSDSAGQQRRMLKPASQAEIRQALRKIYADPNSNRPNVNEAYKLLKRSLPNARKGVAMPILGEPEFKVQRRPSGNQPER
jgi:hypothetical protein